jgi:hypothetical protein
MGSCKQEDIEQNKRKIAGYYFAKLMLYKIGKTVRCSD